MPKKRFIVKLTPDERDELEALTRKGQVRARKMKRAQILLKADTGATDPQIMAALDVSRPCVERLRKRFVEGGLAPGRNEDPPPRPLDLAPAGRSGSAARLRGADLARDRAAGLEKNDLKPWLKQEWCIPEVN